MRIGIFGSRGVGKTSCFACLYGDSKPADAAVSFPETDSRSYLEGLWEDLVQGKSMEGTAAEPLRPLSLNLTDGDETWNLKTCDYAGRLIESGGKGGAGNEERQLRQSVESWLHESDAILIFLDITTRGDVQDSYLRDRQDELDRLLGALGVLAKGGKVGKPLALVLTKWDVLGPISGDLVAERARAERFIQGRERLGRIISDLRLGGGGVEVFPAVGVWSQPGSPQAAGGRTRPPLRSALRWSGRRGRAIKRSLPRQRPGPTPSLLRGGGGKLTARQSSSIAD